MRSALLLMAALAVAYAEDAPADAPMDGAPGDADAPADAPTESSTPEPSVPEEPIVPQEPEEDGTGTSVTAWCETNADCQLFGDGKATCRRSDANSTAKCVCGLDGFYNPVVNGVTVYWCMQSTGPVKTLITVRYTLGLYEMFTSSVRAFVQTSLSTALNMDYTLYTSEKGSIVTYGGGEMPLTTLVQDSQQLGETIASSTRTSAANNQVLNVNGGVSVAVVLANSSSATCYADNAQQAMVNSAGRCIVLACWEGYDVVTTATESYCDEQDAELSDGDIVGLVFAALIGCCALAAIVYCCFIHKKPEQQHPRELQEVEVKEEPAAVTEPAYNPDEVTREVVVPEPVAEPAPEPVPEPVPEPEPVVEEPVPEPVPVPVVPAGPTEEERLAAVRKIQDRIRKYQARCVYLRILKDWKDQEAARKAVLAHGKSGSIGCGLDAETLTISKVNEGSGAEAAGVMAGDLIVAIQTRGRGGHPVYTPVTSRNRFLEGIGTAREVFEGSEIKFIVFRDPAAKEEWQSKKPADPAFNNKAETMAWVEAAREIEPREEIEITVKEETEKTKKTRLRIFNNIKEKKGIEDMDVELVNSFMSDPDACLEFTKKVYEEADADKSGFLQEEEITNVFNIMSKHTGCPSISPASAKKLFYVMDISGDGEVSFDEFYPIFRSYQLQMIHLLLYSEGPADFDQL